MIYLFNAYGNLRANAGGPEGFIAQNLKHHAVRGLELGRHHTWHSPVGWRSLPRCLPLYNRLRRRTLGLPEAFNWESWILSIRLTYRREHVASRPVVWFHDAISLGSCLDLIPARQTVLFQPHCPQPMWEEFRDDARPGELAYFQKLERGAFARCDHLVLPNSGAEELYRNWIRRGTPVIHVESGCQPLPAVVPLPLSAEHVYYLFLGRRNAIKGYDLVVQGFEAAHRTDPRLRLIVAGRGKSEPHPAIIDVGYTETPALWLHSADYLLNANRHSYFDLSFMEALSAGIPVLATQTEGHRTLADLGSRGIGLIASPDPEAVCAAILANRLKRRDNQAAAEDNRRLHATRFASEHYRARLEANLTSRAFTATPLS